MTEPCRWRQLFTPLCPLAMLGLWLNHKDSVLEVEIVRNKEQVRIQALGVVFELIKQSV